MSPVPHERRRSLSPFHAAIAASALVVTASMASASPQQLVWADVNGAPVTFADEAALLAFLRDANIADNEKIKVGITGPRQLLLEQNGMRVNAVFRAVDETHTRVRLPDGSYYQKLRDFSGYEVAAYEVSKLLAMDSVPPATTRRVGSDSGTIQIWVEATMMEQERVEKGLRAPDPMSWRKQTQEMMIFDELIGNIDRNPGNLLIDANWKIWLIDHTRAFQQGKDVKNAGRILFVREGMFEALKQLDVDTVRASVGTAVEAKEVNELFERRDQLVAHIQGLIDQRGAEAGLYQ